MKNLAYFNNIRAEILSRLEKAEKEVLIAMAWFTNEELFNACVECLKRGVVVKLVLLDDLINHCDFGVDFNVFINMKGSLFYLYPPTEKFLHHKFCIIDDKILITGSYNWTNYAETRNLENIIVTNDMSLIKDYKENFYELLNELEQATEFDRVKQAEIPEKDFIGRIGDIAQEIYALPKRERKSYAKQFEEKRNLTQTELPDYINPSSEVRQDSYSKSYQDEKGVDLNQVVDFKYPISKYSIGFKANLKDKGGKEGVKIMIEKGQPLPYTITRDAQSHNSGEATSMNSNLEVYYGDSTEISKCFKFGETLTLKDLPKMKQGEVKFKIVMTLDETGTLSIKFVCTNTGTGLESKQSNKDFIEYSHS